MMERDERRLSGVILAGGDREQMTGVDKSLLPYHGKLLILEQIERMRELCDEIMIVTNEPGLYLPIIDRSVRLITNAHPSRRFLSGLHAALQLAAFADAWVVAEGMPWISPEAAKAMWTLKRELMCDAVVPTVGAYAYPLHGIYDKMAAQAASAVLNAGKEDVSDMFRLIDWHGVSEQELSRLGIPECFKAIETFEDYERFSQPPRC